VLKKKSILTVAATAVLLLGISIAGGGTSPVFAATKKQNPQQIMREIGDKYKVGEVLSDEDAELVKKYAFQAPQKGQTSGVTIYADAQPDNWKVTGSASNSVFTGSLSGSIYVGLNLWENNFRGTLTTKVTKGTPTSFKSSVQMEAYGLVGAGGTKIGKVADFVVTSDWTASSNSSFTYTFDQPFNASVAYYYVTPKGAVKNASGTLEIVGTGTKQ
jgi:hypothetical protein